MALFPKRIDLDDASIAMLREYYADATDDLNRIIRVTVGGHLTLMTVRHAKALIAQRLAELRHHTSDWAEQNITIAYNQGKHDAIAQLGSFKSALAAIAATEIAINVKLNAQHDEAIQALAEAMQTRLDQATNQMYRSSVTTLMDALNVNVRGRIASGTTDQAALKKSILKDLNRLDVNALIDKGGKQWAPDVYADMLSRTSLTQARNQALADALRSQDFDLVVVSAHGAEDACGPWEDTVLSMTGAVAGFPTLDDATGSGLFHVNCKHALGAVDPADYPDGYLTAT